MSDKPKIEAEDGMVHVRVSDEKTDTNIHIDLQPTGAKTAELICNWCGEPHAVEAAYHLDIITRGKERLDEAGVTEIKPEDTWTCGKCMMHIQGFPEELKKRMKTDCHDHEVPKESKRLPPKFWGKE